MHQRSLFHRDDPSTSREAAEHMERSGKLGTNKAIVYEAVRKHPNLTAPELAHYTRLGTYETARRLSDLKAELLVVQGIKRRCGVSGNNRVVWKVSR